MLDTAQQYDVHLGTRLLDFFGGTTPWYRRLWSVGFCLTLEEILEAAEAVRASILSGPSLDNLVAKAKDITLKDPGVGAKPQMGALVSALRLRKDLRLGDFEYQKIKFLLPQIRGCYLDNWATVLGASTKPCGPERAARAIASHMLDIGFDPDYLHRWWDYRIHHEAGTRSLADLVREAHGLCQQPMSTFEIYVSFADNPPKSIRHSQKWLTESAFSKVLGNLGVDPAGVRHVGGLLFQIEARDPQSAVSQVAERVDRYSARVAIGARRGELQVGPHVWVKGETDPIALVREGRRVIVEELEKSRLLLEDTQDLAAGAAVELLAPLVASAPCPAVTGAWAAIEAMLAPRTEELVRAGDRLATVVACSLPRAELTHLSYKVESGTALDAALQGVKHNRSRALHVADALTTTPNLPFVTPSDTSAGTRVAQIIASPATTLEDIRLHITQALRRLYRLRNLILHGGKTDAIALRGGLRTCAPIIAAGMDQIIFASSKTDTSPLQLAAKASARLETIRPGSGQDLISLLQ